MTNNPADLGDGQTYGPHTPMDDLVAELAEARRVADEAAQTPLTIADVAAAAFVALETIVNILGKEKGDQVIKQFEDRAAAFAVAFEEEQQ